MPEARAAYQKALSMNQQEPEKRFLKKRLAELSNLGDAKRLRVQDK
jgi:predicted RNA polymerase sigma factor